MIKYTIKAGTTDVSVVIRILKSSDGTAENGIVFNTASLDLEYRREGAVTTDITEADLTDLTTAHTDGGFKLIGNGYYRLDLPDAAVASGVKGVLVHGSVPNCVIVGCYVELVAYDPFDSVRAGLTALPNAAAEAVGGLFTRGAGAGQIEQEANGRININVKAIAGNTVAATNLRESALGIVTFTVTTGSTTEIVETTLAEATADHYNDRMMVFVTGALAGQIGQIFEYDGSGSFRLYKGLTDTPANGDTGVIV